MIQPNIFVYQFLVSSSSVIRAAGLLVCIIGPSLSILISLLVEKFIIHIAFLHLSTYFHKALNALMNSLILPHLLYLIFITVQTRKVSEIKISIILHNTLTIIHTLQFVQNCLLLSQNVFIGSCIFLLLLVPIFYNLLCLHVLQLRFLFDKNISRIEPRVELVKRLRTFSSFTTLIPILHLSQSSLKLLLRPNK